MQAKTPIGIIVAALFLFAFTGAQAQDRRFEQQHRFERDRNIHHPHNARWHSDGRWLVPVIVGGAIVIGATQYARPPVQIYPIQTGQLPLPPLGYHWSQINDADCQCMRIVLIPN